MGLLHIVLVDHSILESGINALVTEELLQDYAAIEGILSSDGRVLGKMGHSERVDEGLYRNVPGNYDMGLFRSAKKYFG